MDQGKSVYPGVGDLVEKVQFWDGVPGEGGGGRSVCQSVQQAEVLTVLYKHPTPYQTTTPKITQ